MAPLSLITAGTVKMMMMMIIAMMMPFCNIHDGDKDGQDDETITMLSFPRLMSKSSVREDPKIECEDDEENI